VQITGSISGSQLVQEVAAELNFITGEVATPEIRSTMHSRSSYEASPVHGVLEGEWLPPAYNGDSHSLDHRSPLTQVQGELVCGNVVRQ